MTFRYLDGNGKPFTPKTNFNRTAGPPKELRDQNPLETAIKRLEELIDVLDHKIKDDVAPCVDLDTLNGVEDWSEITPPKEPELSLAKERMRDYAQKRKEAIEKAARGPRKVSDAEHQKVKEILAQCFETLYTPKPVTAEEWAEELKREAKILKDLEVLRQLSEEESPSASCSQGPSQDSCCSASDQ